MTPANAMKLNAVALYVISAVLLVAFYFQFELGELPCPLCLLQRVAFTALAVGPVLTLRHGPRPGHYSLIILAALLGAAIASRQMLLHIMPGARADRDRGGLADFRRHARQWRERAARVRF